MARQNSVKITSRARLALAVLLAGTGTAWIDLLMQPRWAASALGSICGHAGKFALHCPACYTAAALVVAGIGFGVSAMVPAPARIRGR